MSRTDGQYPSYERLEISVDEWPSDYWTNARACANCGKKWPDHPAFYIDTVCCGTTTVEEEGPSDVRWPEAVKALLEYRFNQWYDAWNEGKSDEQLLHDDPVMIEEEIEKFREAMSEREHSKMLDRAT